MSCPHVARATPSWPSNSRRAPARVARLIPSGACEAPKPGMSGAITRFLAASACQTGLHENAASLKAEWSSRITGACFGPPSQ